MAKRNKLEKFSDLSIFCNVLELSEDGFESGKVFTGIENVAIKGNWNELYFNNKNPVILELACGRGEYTCALAQKYPNKNFIGVDIKGARIWKGAKFALKNKLNNVAFLRIRIEFIEYYFKYEEIDEIWITFPDPFLKKKKSSRRLTSQEFLVRYQKILKNQGIIHLKTDDEKLYQFTLTTIDGFETAKLIESHSDIYNQFPKSENLEIQTYYEINHLKVKRKIKYIKFSLNHMK